MVKWSSGSEWGAGIGRIWYSTMPEFLLGAIRMLFYFIPLQNDGYCTEYYWKVLCNFGSVGEVGVFLYVCNFVYLGQLLYFVFGKLWEVDSFGCFAWWRWAGHQKVQSSLRWETAHLLQSIFCCCRRCSCPWRTVVRKTEVTAQLQAVCHPSLPH